MNALDIVIVVLMLGAAYHGQHVGAVSQLLSFAGFSAGLAIGVALVLRVAPHVHNPSTKTFVAIALLVVPASVFAGLGRRLGFRAWRTLRRAHFGPADSVLGGVIAIAGTLVVCWLAASILVNTAVTSISSAISGSRIIRSVESVMPPVPDSFATVERYLAHSNFPEVLVNILPQSVGPVQLPNAPQVSEAVTLTGPSTVKVVALGCGDEQEGSGFAVAGGLIVTNAHVIAGTTSISVSAPDGQSVAATPVYFDPELDLALLRTAPLGLRPLTVDPDYVQRGEPAVVLGYPGGGPFDARQAGIVTRFDAEGRDIYDESIVTRTVYELQAIVRPGNSGGPLVTPTGEVIGVVFSRSTTNSDIGYALASPAVNQKIVASEALQAPVSTESCTS